jgi:hypothetical protein
LKAFAIPVLLLLSLNTAAYADPYFVQCYDFGCKTTREIHFDAAQWDGIRALFGNGVADSAVEKQAIRRAVALMERFSGELTGTRLDKAGNYAGIDLPGQMDCIDESTNTFQYLSALQELGLLKWHRVGKKHRRIIWFATHWTATIREIDSGRVFAVDSWYRDNGELPYLQPLSDWARKLDFPSAYNPELAAN